MPVTRAGNFAAWYQAVVSEADLAEPEGAAPEAIDAKLKALKLTIRNAPLAQESAEGKRCIFSDAPAKEFVLVGRAY